VLCVEDMKNAYSDQVGNPQESDNLQDLNMAGRIKIKTLRNRLGGVDNRFTIWTIRARISVLLMNRRFP